MFQESYLDLTKFLLQRNGMIGLIVMVAGLVSADGYRTL